MPIDLKSVRNEHIAEELRKDPNIRKIAHHGSSKSFLSPCLPCVPDSRTNPHLPATYAFTAPKAFRFLDRALVAIESMAELVGFPSLIRPFPFSIFPAVTFNLGNNVITRLHRDFNNIIFGMCAIHALGRYDYTKGGHLILWDWKIVIEFPPGTTILIPSAAVAHGNTPLHDATNETRNSFTQYVPGGLIRWFMYGFRTEVEIVKQDPQEWEEIKARADERWENACEMFSRVDELHDDIVNHLLVRD